MHDWPLLSISVEWEAGRVELTFKTHARGLVSLLAEGVTELHVPRQQPWGPSDCVNKVKGPSATNGGLQTLEIQMRSGDCIRIVAVSFQMPAKI